LGFQKQNKMSRILNAYIVGKWRHDGFESDINTIEPSPFFCRSSLKIVADVELLLRRRAIPNREVTDVLAHLFLETRLEFRSRQYREVRQRSLPLSLSSNGLSGTQRPACWCKRTLLRLQDLHKE
jgi:hypothetical protein